MWVDQLAASPLPEGFKNELRSLLSSESPFMAMLGQVQRRAHEMAWSLQAADLTTDEGRMKALKDQGTVQGLLMAIEVMLAPVMEGEEDV